MSVPRQNRRVPVRVHVARLAALAPLVSILLVARPAQAADTDRVPLGSMPTPPASLSTTGDFATDTYGDPWDFSNDQDVPPVPAVGVTATNAVSIANGVLSTTTHDTSEIRFLMNWSQLLHTLPWGHDSAIHPIDAGRYTQATFRLRASADLQLSVQWVTASGQIGAIPFALTAGTWQTVHFDLTDRKNFPGGGADAAWAGPIVKFMLFRGLVPGNPAVDVDVDYMRVHRADAPREPDPALAVPQLVAPSERAGADYATVENGNPWDFAGLNDIADSNGLNNLAINADGDLTGVTVGNDSWISLPLGPTLNTDRYHHLTIDICYGGGFSLGGQAGGGMVGRMVWLPHGSETMVVSQDFLVFPGCQSINIDMVTNPPAAINDESVDRPTGWRGVRIDTLRFDLNEDPGQRPFTLKNISLTDDLAVSSSTPITFRDAAGAPGATADLYASSTYGSFTGTKIASDLPVASGVNTFNWNGTDSDGDPMPNGVYWLYLVITTDAGPDVVHATAATRIEKPVPSTPSYFVPLAPSRVLDTRNGTGGNIYPVAEGMFTEVRVTGVGGVPEGDVTAVVLNVTATNASGDGYITAWPSGEPRPLVSNVNFLPLQTVPNLVTVKVGANGRVNLYNSAGFTDLIADVSGYYTTKAPATGGKFTALTPFRLLDTRDGTGGTNGPLGLNGQLNLTVTGVGGVPSTGVSGVALNVTVDQPTGTGFLTVWPAGEPRPTASTHNYTPSLTVANLVLAKVGAGGQVSVYNSAGLTHVVADVIGYFSANGGLFVPISPLRVVDTRDNTGGVPGALGEGETRSLTMTTGPVPGAAKATVVNVTSVDSTVPSFITVWPTGSPRPLASTLNPRPFAAVPNQAYLRLGSNGRLDTFNNAGSTNVIVDVFGYFTE